MHLEFSHPAYRTPITTSRIEEIRESRDIATGYGRAPDCLSNGDVTPAARA
jgi:hypothetical protein